MTPDKPAEAREREAEFSAFKTWVESLPPRKQEYGFMAAREGFTAGWLARASLAAEVAQPKVVMADPFEGHPHPTERRFPESAVAPQANEAQQRPTEPTNIHSPFNACMYREHCKSLESAVASASQRDSPCFGGWKCRHPAKCASGRRGEVCEDVEALRKHVVAAEQMLTDARKRDSTIVEAARALMSCAMSDPNAKKGTGCVGKWTTINARTELVAALRQALEAKA